MFGAALPYWLWPGDDRPTSEIEDEITEELQLHLDLLAEEQQRNGVDPLEAKRRAAEQFGDTALIARQCRGIQQGDAPMLKRTQVVLTLLLLLAVAIVGVRQWQAHATTAQYMDQTTGFMRTIQSDMSNLRNQLQFADQNGDAPVLHQVARRTSPRADLTGVVTNASGEPVAKADVMFVVKTWPNNRYRQDDYAVKTDAEGRFTLKKKLPTNGQYGFNAVVAAEGYAIVSQYVLVEDPAGAQPEPVSFQLEPSKRLQLTIRDQEGEPLPRTLVAPSGRTTEDDIEVIVYHQGSQPAWVKTDEQGVARIDWFVPGDIGAINIRPRGRDWQEKKLDISESPDYEITVSR